MRLLWNLRQAGFGPVTFSPFAERHGTGGWCEAWRKHTNSGKGGGESAEEIVPAA